MADLEAIIEAAAERGAAKALEARGLRPAVAMTLREAGRRLSIGPDAVRKLIVDGDLRGWRLHGDRGDWRVTDRELERYMAEREGAA